VLGDGDDNQSAVTRDMALEMAHRAEAVVYTISTNRTGSRQSGDKVLRFLATETGGVTFNPFQAEELSQSFTDIANELRHQYFIMYSPQPFAADGSFHRVEVKCNVQERGRSGSQRILRSGAWHVTEASRESVGRAGSMKDWS
jgi:VWFA-related protein